MEEAKRVRYYPVNRDRLSIGAGIMGDGGRRNERLVFLVEEHESILYWDDHLFPVNPTHRYGEAEIRASMLYIYIYIIYGDASHLHFSKREIRGRIRRKKKLIVLMNL